MFLLEHIKSRVTDRYIDKTFMQDSVDTNSSPSPTTTPTEKRKKLEKLSIPSSPPSPQKKKKLEKLNLPASAPESTPTIVNKGTGAGGANTNATGKSFEQKTENETRLLASGFIRKQIPGCEKNKTGYYLVKETITNPDQSIIYLTQGGLKAYFNHFFKKEMCRHPDEAYLFRNGDNYTLKILEKKNQNGSGSVDTKLLAGLGFIKEYEILLGESFAVKYAFCISSFMKKDYVADCVKSKALREINKTYGIAVLFGEDPDYYETLDAWIYGPHASHQPSQPSPTTTPPQHLSL
jgi:hypothetical protein